MFLYLLSRYKALIEVSRSEDVVTTECFCNVNQMVQKCYPALLNVTSAPCHEVFEISIILSEYLAETCKLYTCDRSRRFSHFYSTVLSSTTRPRVMPHPHNMPPDLAILLLGKGQARKASRTCVYAPPSGFPSGLESTTGKVQNPGRLHIRPPFKRFSESL